MTTATANELKQQGNSAFSAGDYDRAIELFSQAVDCVQAVPDAQQQQAVLYSNRSAAYCGKRQYTEALEDAEKCVKLRPDWSKV